MALSAFDRSVLGREAIRELPTFATPWIIRSGRVDTGGRMSGNPQATWKSVLFVAVSTIATLAVADALLGLAAPPRLLR
jgi:hypothetical protein